MTEKLFKVLGKDGISCHGGRGKWSLPHDGKPGEWMPPIEGKLVPCENGYHLCRESDLINWLNVTIFEAEYQGERIDCDDKIVVRVARLIHYLNTWNERTARLFACDCAEHVLHIFERDYLDDNRPRGAIKVARQFANGVATQEELDAARDAARDAVGGAARDAAWTAVRAAARDAARDAARGAARDAAWDAARAAAWTAVGGAAWGAARDAEQEWQLAQLMKYLYPVEGQDLRVECEGTFDIDEEDNN